MGCMRSAVYSRRQDLDHLLSRVEGNVREGFISYGLTLLKRQKLLLRRPILKPTEAFSLGERGIALWTIEHGLSPKIILPL